MNDIIYERDYTKRRQEPDSQTDAVFGQAVNGGFFRRYSKTMRQIPKAVIPQDKENYEYLLSRCDEMAEYWNGRIRGIVDYHQYQSIIDVFLPALEFTGPEGMKLMGEIAEKAHMVTITSEEGGIHLSIMIHYFEDQMPDGELEKLAADAVMPDRTMASMLCTDALTPEEDALFRRMNAVLDWFESETDYDRTAVFRSVLEKMSHEDEENQTLERMAALAEAMLEKTWNEKNGN